MLFSSETYGVIIVPQLGTLLARVSHPSLSSRRLGAKEVNMFEIP